jgi:hypothetical protein
MCSFAITQFRMRRVVFAARAADVPTYRSLLDADLTQAAEWVNRHGDWSPIEVRSEFMREDAVKALQAFEWTWLDRIPSAPHSAQLKRCRNPANRAKIRELT